MENDGKMRCGWGTSTPAMLAYHDNEWGVPLHDDRKLFELLVLEGAQAGLSWRTILDRRQAYRDTFHGFDIERVARMRDSELEKVLTTSGVIRNRLKVYSARDNAGGEGNRQLRQLPMGARWRPTDCECLDPDGPGAGADRGLRPDEQGAAQVRLPICGLHHLLRFHAGNRDGERSSPVVLVPEPVAGMRFQTKAARSGAPATLALRRAACICWHRRLQLRHALLRLAVYDLHPVRVPAGRVAHDAGRRSCLWIDPVHGEMMALLPSHEQEPSIRADRKAAWERFSCD
jgi:hypothetical protein